MRYAVRTIILKLISIHYSVFIIIIVITWINFLRHQYITYLPTGPIANNLVILFLGIVLNIYTIWVHTLVTRIYRKLIKRERHYLIGHSEMEKRNRLQVTDLQQGDVLNICSRIYKFENERVPKTRQKLMYPCGSSNLLLILIQISILLTSFYIGIYFYYCITLHLNWYWWAFYSFCAVANFSIYPAILFSTTKIMYTGEMVNYHLLSKSWDKQLSVLKKEHLRYRKVEDEILIDDIYVEMEKYKNQLEVHYEEDSINPNL